ncbi:MAG: alpha/beta hydrolase [Candidatus Binatus sp.]|jgi:pimeloyl-ACP methyl ester carboxylesterase|uniref:alpha/beta fold hydrolase n=1 Tax=Candidatus Binatus sp. TaxID=2811406 RepID=UPI003D0A5D80
MKAHRFVANGLALNCLDYGGEGKPPILFLHGGSAHAHWWDFVAPAFVGDFHVLALDQRGHGESDWADEWAYGSRHYVSDLDQVIDQWGFGAPILVGHSMGAHNVLAYAVEHGERLRAMVAIDPPPDYPERALEFLQSIAEKPARRFESLDEAAGHFRVLPRETLAKKEILEHVARRSFKQHADGGWTHKLDRRTMIREPSRVWNSLHRIECPALIVKITKSPLLDRELAKKMAGQLANGRLVEVDDSYHHVMLDNPEALIEVVRHFVDGLK